ncbi:MAG: DUF2764 domain-containing protein [Bacteroidales bacterium]|nr:DUF2764 domain-containing protein [Bacteroidales bacterium]
MNNYEYIIASLPVLHQEDARSERVVAQELIDEIRAQLSERDSALLDLLLKGYDPEQLDADFYRAALKHPNRFIRDWFRFDLDLRNATVSYLNASLGRPEELDRILLPEHENDEFEESEAVQATLNCGDILQRERGLDELRWQKIEDLTMMDFFDIEAILGFVARLKIIDRWLQLDPEVGRSLFRQMVERIRSTYDNKKQNITI